VFGENHANGLQPDRARTCQHIARAINLSNAQPDNQGMATVNPIFTWVSLAKRIPVRTQIDKVPKGVQLIAGMTATVQIDR
jgi:multidrug resistance efflux pump